MAQPKTLPDPRWDATSKFCAACGYSLDGLGEAGACPECGTRYSAFQLVLAGVPNRKSNRFTPRSLAWGVVVVGWMLHAYGWGLEMLFSRWLVLVVTAALAAGLIWLIATGKRERQGLERFIVTPTGIQRVPFKFDAGSDGFDAVFIPWDGADGVELRRISNVWRRLRIGTRHGARLRRIVFDAGIRCPDSMAAQVQALIAQALAGEVPAADLAGASGTTPPGQGGPADMDARGPGVPDRGLPGPAA